VSAMARRRPTHSSGTNNGKTARTARAHAVTTDHRQLTTDHLPLTPNN
jgi:hypothetical protein